MSLYSSVSTYMEGWALLPARVWAVCSKMGPPALWTPSPTVPPHAQVHHIPADDASQGSKITYPHVAWEDRREPTYNPRPNSELKQLLSLKSSVPVPVTCCSAICAPTSIALCTRFIDSTPLFLVRHERQMLQSHSPTKAPKTWVSAVIIAPGMHFAQLFSFVIGWKRDWGEGTISFRVFECKGKACRIQEMSKVCSCVWDGASEGSCSHHSGVAMWWGCWSQLLWWKEATTPALKHCSLFLHCSGNAHDRTWVTLQNGERCPAWLCGRGKKVVKPLWDCMDIGQWEEELGHDNSVLSWSTCLQPRIGEQPWKRFRSHAEMLKVQSRTVQILCKAARGDNATEKREKIQFLKSVQ